MCRAKDNRSYEERAEDLTKVITWSILNTVRKYYGGNIDRLKTDYQLICSGKADKNATVNFQRRFGFNRNFGIFSKNLYRRIIGYTQTPDGKNAHVKLSQVLQYCPKWLHYQRHFNKNYRKTGKTFSVSGYFYVDFH